MRILFKLLLISASSLLTSPFAHATPYYWPEFSKVTLDGTSDDSITGIRFFRGTASWYLTQRDDNFGNREFSHNVTSGTGIIPTFLRTYDGMVVGPTTMVYNVESSMSVKCSLSAGSSNGMITTQACADDFKKRNGTGGTFEFKTHNTIAHSQLDNNNTSCLAWAMANPNTSASLLQTIGTPHGLFEGCIKMPPDMDSWCELTVPEINFEYGEISSRQADGYSIEKPVTFQCGKDGMEFMFKTFLDNDDLPLNNGMTAELRINGGPVSNKIFTGYKNIVSLNLTSTLRGTPKNTGAFSGYTILAITYP